MRDAVVVPSALALLPEYAGREDPVADLRAACLDAVGGLVTAHPDRILLVAATPAAARVGRHLLDATGLPGRAEEAVLGGEGLGAGDASVDGVLVVANGTATRGEKAPGHLDERAFAFDEAVGTALDMGDPAVLRALDDALGRELWCHDVPAFRALGRLADGRVSAALVWAGDPYGVQYWVARWTCGSWSTG
jgi:hypothetical protein